jgi:P63C domain
VPFPLHATGPLASQVSVILALLTSSRERIKPFVVSALAERIRNPIVFITPAGGRAYGYEAEVLVELCEAVLAARAEGVLQKQQMQIAQQCELIMRGLARVGIVALVDEATGFQEVRKRDALHKILEAYISPELMPWTKRFPNSFYEEMFRLHDWEYDPESVARPGVVGVFTNKYVYDQLPPGVLDELRRQNPKTESGRRRAKLHQFLTDDVGNPHLERQIASTTALMRAAEDWPSFKRMFARAFPKVGDQLELTVDRAQE